jgi:hypothetical protein
MTPEEVAAARQIVLAVFRFLPFMVRMLGVITGDDNYIGLAGIQNADQQPEFVLLLVPFIVALLRAGWADNLQTITTALSQAPELAEQGRQVLELPAKTVQANLSRQPPEVREQAQRIIDGTLNGTLDLGPHRTPG